MITNPSGKLLLLTTITALTLSLAKATSNYTYGPREYVTISNGISSDNKYAIAAHGDGEMGYDRFRLYLFDAASGRKIGPLDEIIDTLDTGASAFAAKWSEHSSVVTIVYRVDRHSPLKSMTYHLSKGRAIPDTKEPISVEDQSLIDFWKTYGSGSKTMPQPKIFGTPKQQDQ